MNYSGKIFVFTFLILIFFSCKKDNYDPPSVQLTGQLSYNGDPIFVESGQVSFQLQQTNYSTPAPISGSFDQNGKLSMLVFPGNYTLVIPGGQGPFLWTGTSGDGSDLNVTGNMNFDIPVTPYYLISGLQLNNSGKNVNATFNLTKIVNDANAKNVEYVALYINETQFVSESDNGSIAKTTINSVDNLNNINLSVVAPDEFTQNYVFARVGVKIQNVEDLLYSAVQKINF